MYPQDNKLLWGINDQERNWFIMITCHIKWYGLSMVSGLAVKLWSMNYGSSAPESIGAKGFREFWEEMKSSLRWGGHSCRAHQQASSSWWAWSFFAVVCWGTSIRASDTNRLKVIMKAGSVISHRLNTCEAVERRTINNCGPCPSWIRLTSSNKASISDGGSTVASLSLISSFFRITDVFDLLNAL